MIYNSDMATSVRLRTAVPSVSEFGKSLGISERVQKSLISLVKRNAAVGQFVKSRKGKTVELARSEKVFRAVKR